MGKSSLLEALITYLKKDEIGRQIYTWPHHRGEWITNDSLQDVLNGLTSLFYDRKILNQKSEAVYIGRDEQTGIFLFR